MTSPYVRLLLVFLLLASMTFAKEPPAARVVNLTVSDGTILKASYFGAGKPGPGVLLLHQCNRQRKVWDDLATKLAASGLNVLTVDYRGFGESGGKDFNQLTPQEAALVVAEKWPGDLDAAFNYLAVQPGVKRDTVGVGGASCGVNQSIQMARRHPEVKSLVLLSGATDRDGRQFLHNSATLPLFGSAADDDGNAVEVMQWLLGLSSNPGNKFLHYQAGGHGVEMFPKHPELPAAIADWFGTTLVKTPGRAPAGKATVAARKDVDILELIDQADGAAKARQMLADARSHDPNAKLFSETIVNLLGYEHIQSGDKKGAIEILKLNAVAYPDSPNVYDSLSDAYLADGQNDLARENAQKALDRLASDVGESEQRRTLIKESAMQKLKQLEAARR